MNQLTTVPGILLLHDGRPGADASTVMEHLGAFQKYSEFPVYPLNVHVGIPPGLNTLEFAVTVFHYTLRPAGAWITPELDAYLSARTRTYKVAFFQDEIWYFKERRQFLTRYAVDCLYTRHKPRHWQEIYGEVRSLKKLVFYLAGYLASELVEAAARLTCIPDARPIDVGYRGRRLPYYLGRGALEKTQIAEAFQRAAAGHELHLDISTHEDDRLYGEAWHQFLARCKAMLGVEGGVSVIDLEDISRIVYDALIKAKPELTFAEFADVMGNRFANMEERIDYRAFTPRHFEAAAFRNTQILFAGRYDGMLIPGVHYIPLCKDFSNFSDVLAQLKNPDRLRELADRTWQDLIGSGRYSYQNFIRSFDAELQQSGVIPGPKNADQVAKLRAYVEDWEAFQSRYMRVCRDVHAAYGTQPALRRRLDRIRIELERYSAANPRPLFPPHDYTASVRREVQTRERELWEKLGHLARLNLDVGSEPTSKQYTRLDRMVDALCAIWRRLVPQGSKDAA